jgi:hypothetical protein
MGASRRTPVSDHLAYIVEFLGGADNGLHANEVRDLHALTLPAPQMVTGAFTTGKGELLMLLEYSTVHPAFRLPSPFPTAS